MKIYLPNQSKQKLGGGMSFIRNFHTAMGHYFDDVVFTDTWDDADIVFIVSSTLPNPEEIDQAYRYGKKIVLRVDNMPRNSRNRNTGSSRLKKYAEMADAVVFQSNWAKFYMQPIIRKGKVIYNAVDQEIFYPPKKRPSNRFLYVQFNRDENKRPTEAFYDFHIQSRAKRDSELWLVGQFSPELVEYNFDFWNAEKIKYFTPTDSKDQMADYMRACRYLYFPAFMDACPNTVIEALSCGMEILLLNDIGGTHEIVNLFEEKGREYFGLKRMAEEYHNLFKSL